MDTGKAAVGPVPTRRTSIVEALAIYAPAADGQGTSLSLLGEAHDYTSTTVSWGIPGATVGYFYSHGAPDGARHGYVVVNASPGADLLVLDAYLADPGGTSDDWRAIAAAAEIALRSFQSPGA